MYKLSFFAFLRKRFNRNRRKYIVGIFSLSLILWFVPWVFLLYSDSISINALDAKSRPIKLEVGPKTKEWVPIENVSRHLIHAIIVSEDSKFYGHSGFDFSAIKMAYKENKKKGRFARGGSTISQQVVKMAFLSREKTYVRKAREALGTVLMELFVPKRKILEWYINLVEFGGGVYGVKKAGIYYFKTRPDLLTTEQAIHLALVIPSPNKWSSGLKSKKLTPFGHRRFSRIAHNLRRSGFIGDQELSAVLAKGDFGRPIAGYKTFDPEAEVEDCTSKDSECADGEDSKRPEVPIEIGDPEFVRDAQENNASQEAAIKSEAPVSEDQNKVKNSEGLSK